MTFSKEQEVFEISFNLRTEWQAHSLSNVGNRGSNSVYPRRQLLACGLETDAISGDIMKHHNASVLRDHVRGKQLHLCPACANGDGRRASAVGEYNNATSVTEILACALCDAHGFLITAKKGENGADGRQCRSKASVVEYSMALAIPETFYETPQLFVRHGVTGEDTANDGQMIFKVKARSGAYAMCIRYRCASIGADSHTHRLAVTDSGVRRQRHQMVLESIRDQALSPSGAMTGRMLPHLTSLSGAIVAKLSPGRAPMYSPLAPTFIDQLKLMSSVNASYVYLAFASASEFSIAMEDLIQSTIPYNLDAQRTAPVAPNAIAGRQDEHQRE